MRVFPGAPICARPSYSHTASHAPPPPCPHHPLLFAARCIDEYASSRASTAVTDGAAPASPRPLDARLEGVAVRMFRRCLQDGAFSQGLGLALESQRLDWVEDVLERGGEVRGGLRATGRETRLARCLLQFCARCCS